MPLRMPPARVRSISKTTNTEPVTRWSTVFFQVEDAIFEVPRHRFTEHSAVFEGMFHIPQAGDAESVEGTSEGFPITLEGYEAADFRALIKVLYPAPNDVIFGSYTLTKDEWVGILNLSTRWQMKMVRRRLNRPIALDAERRLTAAQMREHAIMNLSKMSLASCEKVTLARAHKVAKWLREGLSEIVTQEEVLNPIELKSQVGIETAFMLMWIQNQTLRSLQTRSKPPITLGIRPNAGSDAKVNEVFKEEIASYESWD
ncbi:hypothetical protein EST38_g12251 [Candolleomyces aberdarensis]|uniref:BTB domain-containing protein n=1 Tax=Candolleomyces aberdarensis TaxID=2316362 RepID=A0A4Q2D551_9AGAR|nr:hypothetical protein EST38_g12251 [Candolleomyces aberdarensis]